ncbi:type VII secretion protein EccB [Microbacterium hydrocarbonoxydans]|uniref:type VII secretion protein EccB n=1 Tax=Microbacterium hydrocarbonoxydans TaxID=273678 RepID=UPI00203FF731|nr:type VII secretion protein EccB [Microbacterium hydrocarbonoxydans]MCM3779322.1 type VII secretion protein EccB [Microbacterium hydrocarbonoxydans]
MRIARVLATFVAVSALVVGVMVPISPASAAAAPAMAKEAQGRDIKTYLAGFNAGNIISDAVFTNRNTMSEAQIQAFFNSKVSRCQGGADKWGPIICLKDFTITSVNRPADRYCQGYTGAPNESAARIIYRVAQSCGINPQVLIVMLQKEQGLVTHSWPSMNRYNAALGQGCPDGGVPCDPSYVGFFHQIYGAARQMQIYMEGRYFTYYAPGRTWNILYNPNRDCGSAPVYVANMATSALYYYTPYQPNAAALNAGYGEGDGCSAYGNRNFYNYFTDWFGSTQAASAQMLKDASTGATYLVSQGKRYSFPTAERAVQYTWIAPLQTVPSTQIAAYADAGAAPRAVRTDAGHVYLLDSGRRFGLLCDRALQFGWNCATLPVVGQGQVSIYPEPGTLEPSIAALGTSWLIQGGWRREVPDRTLLLSYGMSSGATVVSDAMAADFPLADPVISGGVYSDGSGGMRAILQNAAVYDVPSEGQVAALSAVAKRLTKDTWARIKASGTLPVAANVAGRNYLLATGGWLQVDAYGSTVPFTPLSVASLAGLPSAGSALGAHFVREQSSVQVFLVSGGTLQTATADQQRWMTATFGVPSQVRVVADTALAGHAGPGQRLVRTADGASYLLDGTSRWRFRDCTQVSDWGVDCGQLSTVTSAELAPYADRGTLERLVRQTDGTTWLVQSGKRREVVDTAVLAPFGIGSATSPVSAAFLRSLPASDPVLGPGVYTDGAGAMLLSNPAGTVRIDDAARVSIVTQSARRLTAESLAFLPPTGTLSTRMLSDGRALILTEQGWLQVDPAHYGGAKSFTAAASMAWSGIPIAQTESRPHFVKDRTSPQTFLVSGGVLQPVDSDASRTWLASYFGLPSALWSVAGGALRGTTFAPGLVVKSPDSTLLITDGATSFRLRDCSTVVAFGRDCGTLSIARLDALGLKDGGTIGSLVRGQGGDTWLVQAAKRREVPDTSILAMYGIGSASSPVTAELLKLLPVSDPVIASGTYRAPSGAMRVVAAGGVTLDVPAAAQVAALKTAAKPLTEESFALVKPSGVLSVRAQSSGISYILSAQGWARVDAANYGALTFPPVSAGVIQAVPVAPAATGARFVREASSTQVFLASGGLAPMTPEQQAWASAYYGVPAAVVVVADGALR